MHASTSKPQGIRAHIFWNQQAQVSDWSSLSRLEQHSCGESVIHCQRVLSARWMCFSYERQQLAQLSHWATHNQMLPLEVNTCYHLGQSLSRSSDHLQYCSNVIAQCHALFSPRGDAVGFRVDAGLVQWVVLVRGVSRALDFFLLSCLLQRNLEPFVPSRADTARCKITKTLRVKYLIHKFAFTYD